ncbi:MAG: hypothetical protein WBC55_07690 [Dehalococcoidia bacterium]
MGRKYGGLHLVGTLIIVIAWIELVLGVLGSILAGVLGADALTAVDMPGGTYAAIVIIVGIIVSVVYFLFLFGFGRLIHVVIDVERKTRVISYRLRTGSREPAELLED